MQYYPIPFRSMMYVLMLTSLPGEIRAYRCRL